MKNILLALCLLAGFSLSAQYTTPNTGVMWSWSDLVVNSDGVVTSIGTDEYLVSEDLTIAPDDQFFQTTAATVYFAPDVLVTVEGVFFSLVNSIFTKSEDEPFAGFRLENGSFFTLGNCTMSGSGGIKSLTENIELVESTFTENVLIQNTGSFLSLSHGDPTIGSCTFSYNEGAAIGSAANSEVAPSILDCTFLHNNVENSNRPHINLGPSGESGTTAIIDCSIEGGNSDQSGGIAISSFFGVPGDVEIIGNYIANNRYGIAIIGNNMTAVISGNEIADNNIQGDPEIGGSGVNFNATATSSAVMYDNDIQGNLWGVTIIGEFDVNLGENTTESPGGNLIVNNTNNGQEYSIYNNGPLDIMAINNCLSLEGTEEAFEANVFHDTDDGILGTVTYWPGLASCVVGIDEIETNAIDLFPNPAQDLVRLEAELIDLKTVAVYNNIGESIAIEYIRTNDGLQLDVSKLPTGIYQVQVQDKRKTYTGKLVKQ